MAHDPRDANDARETTDESSDESEAGNLDLTRRTLLKTTGTVAGAGLLGVGASGSAAAATGVNGDFRNWRAREASKAWDRGFRGRPDRTISLTDSGLDSRHPDEGPWNGITAVVDGDEVKLTRPEENDVTVDESEVFADVDPSNVTAATPKTVGWYDPDSQYDVPRDNDGHGSHVAGIMGGSSRASAFDPDTFREDDSQQVLAAGEFAEYEVNAAAGTGVFGSAYGTGLELEVEGPDGETLDSTAIDSDASTQDNVVVEAPAERDGTYLVRAKPAGGQATSSGVVDRIAVGAFRDPDETVGDRTDGGDAGLHTGVAPDQGLVGLQGLSGPTEDLGENAEEFARIFNMRAVNMSWGYVGGLPLGAFGGTLGNIPASIKDIAQGGILTVAAAGNSATPANGNGAPAVADEAVSVVATGPLDGISAYSSGGIGGIDEDANLLSPEPDDTYMKPDVTAPGGYLSDVVNSVLRGLPNEPEDEQPPIREYTGKAGTSMAAPFTTGIAGLVANAMEFDAPDALTLPEPADTDIDDVLRLKTALLATASETVFTAAPYHRVKTPSYDFGGRDPYEGYGRVNLDAAIDAVTTHLRGTSEEVVGLNLPEDSRAVAGCVPAGPGTLTAEVSFDHYSGGNKGQANGQPPHLDLFVYDAEEPAQHGEPNIVARDMGLQGDATASVSIPRDADQKIYYVVAKLVNVPGAVNGDDVQAHFDLTIDGADDLFVSGTRSDDGSVFTADQTNEIDLTIDPSRPGSVRDAVPSEWTVKTEFSDDVERVEQAEGVQYVYFAEDAEADTDNEYTYLVEAPNSGNVIEDSGRYQFGPAEVEIFGRWIAANGTAETNTVAGLNTNL
ncbi:S8 family serine peptidase [Halococcus agarilyticus]|uniref:S8 family serine peptidase n=1 Tax=Halococcus agarilyticus TaxID=1232219 RepID=UPI000677A491|nr:S8 family serine peptidase [Halococcus agarilyticus]